MNTFDETLYRHFFETLTGHAPFDYQAQVARHLQDGRNVLLRAPTGAGKTWAVLAPFLSEGWRNRPTRLIYALPLRTLAQGVYQQARAAAESLGFPVQGLLDERGREVTPPSVTLQTGEQPDDRFFDRGRVIVTTYDQVLSGLLDGPYGLSDRLHNVNAAAIAGALVVFDEFHLMPAQRAFLTAVAGLRLFDGLCQSVWMTATATKPLEEVLREASNVAIVPATPEESERLYESLPSVCEVDRRLVVENEPLSAESILRFGDGRSIVLANTVARAQVLFANLSEALRRRNWNVPLLLLHSRFFKQDRQTKEAGLRTLFGPGTKSSSILVATQVIEAGIDISCERLHTELCPMNSLIQRAGRCARFPGESGTVHVYRLPNVERNWLPYGDQAGEDIALTKTRELLRQIGAATMHPRTAAQWIDAVHNANDEAALRHAGGWHARLSEALRRIEQNAILRDPKRIADLIRGDDSDSVRVIISSSRKRPETPGEREALSLPRWTLARIVSGGQQIGWFWDGSDEDSPWKPLRNSNDLRLTYAVCFPPDIAQYTSDLGLVLGVAGTTESPLREKIRAPGYSPLHAETWGHHARCVADETQRRLSRECPPEGFLSLGFNRRYGLTYEGLREATRACAVLHDLGKLQQGWQRWAEAAMRSNDSSYQHLAPLAHTDFDPESVGDRMRERELRLSGIRRPSHAPASAFYSLALIARLLTASPSAIRKQLSAACLAAVLAHHGGWLPNNEGPSLAVQILCSGWRQVLTEVFSTDLEIGRISSLERESNKRDLLAQVLRSTVAADELEQWWPVVSYLTRTLRLSDQRATAELSNHE